jgi:hypothetical protein
LALGIGAGAGAKTGAGSGAGCGATAAEAGRAAIVIFDRRRTTPSHSLSCLFNCADISVAAVN